MRLWGGRWGRLEAEQQQQQHNNEKESTTERGFLFVYGEVRARGSRDCLAVRVRRPSTRFDEGGKRSGEGREAESNDRERATTRTNESAYKSSRTGV